MRQDEVRELLSIGRFARLSGLSIGALRHYDELRLLHPAVVDPDTGYRRYVRSQLPVARAIARLRDLEVPLGEIRELLGTDDPAERARRIAVHRARIEARVNRLVRVLHVVRQLSDGKEPIMGPEAAGVGEASSAPAAVGLDAVGLDAQAHRAIGKALFNHVWTLLEAAKRTSDQVDEMIAVAHASAFHWTAGGGSLANRARSQWQIARVYSALGRAEPALWHAQRCLELAEAAVAAGVADDWDVPAALEGLARAQAVAGDRAAAEATRDRARAALEGIADPEDRELIEQDLATAPV
jgi:DNA-binding transcriptional MerR regulator